jgi:dTDP-4-amino-4,6-dideoxygalactose transaminase
VRSIGDQISELQDLAKKEVTLNKYKPFVVTSFGSNLRIYPLGAVILLPQLSNFNKTTSRKKRNC